MATKKQQQQQIGSLQLKRAKTGTMYLRGTAFGNDYVLFKHNAEWLAKHPTGATYYGYEDLDYEEDEKINYSASLWARTSESGNKYLSGVINDKNVVGFYDEESMTFRIYESRMGTKKKATKKKSKPATDEALPF